jgi:hypothetical protein
MKIMPRRSGGAVSTATREHLDATREPTPDHVRLRLMLAYVGATLTNESY